MGHLAFEVDLDKLVEIPALSVYFGGEFLDNVPPEQKWVVPGLIPQGIPAVMASQPGLGKSFLFLQLCIAVATGKPFLNFPASEPRAAVFFGLEDPKNQFHARVLNIIDLYKFADDWSDADAKNFRTNFSAPFINWKSSGATSFLPDLMPNIETLIGVYEAHQVTPGIMVIDTLARVSDGDENTVQGLRPVLNACARIAESGFSPIMLHHVGKGQDGAKNAKDKPTLADRMSTDWIRGSGSIVGNFRCAMQFARISEDEAAGAGMDVDMASRGQILVFGVTKTNNGSRPDWCVIVQDDRGRWSASPDSVELLARFRGSKAVAAFSKQMSILKDIYDARFLPDIDRRAMEQKYWPELVPIKAANNLRQAISKLKALRYLGNASRPELTALGLEKLQVTLGNGGNSNDEE